MKAFSRREFLSTVGSAAAGACGFPAGRTLASGTNAVASSVGGVPLKGRAAQKGVLYGAASSRNALSADPLFAMVFAEQCGILVPEAELKWNTLRPSPDEFNFNPADWLADFARKHQMKFRGHTLVWHLLLPKWFNTYANSANAKNLLLSHIQNVAGHYSGTMHSWDVVNEAIFPEDGRSDKLRNSPWLRLLGPDYIETAFHAAAEADPHALLVWNENLLEEETSYAETKRTSFLQHLQDLVRRNVPVHAIGIQSHLAGDHTDIAGPQFQRFLGKVSDLGLKVLVTEMDVRDDHLPADISVRDSIVADRYYQYLSVVLRQQAVIAVLTWGLSDKYTWLSGDKPRRDHAPVRPLPLNVDMTPAPAWSAIARTFDEAPQH